MGVAMADLELEEDYVRLVLAVSLHRPILLAVYLGPQRWWSEALLGDLQPNELLDRAQILVARAERLGDGFVAGQSRAIATQIQLQMGQSMTYADRVERLLGLALVVPDPAEVDDLRDTVKRLADDVGYGGHGDPVAAWEQDSLQQGDDKWDTAMSTCALGRRYLQNSFPLAISEGVALARGDDPLFSVNLLWEHPQTLRLEVNPCVPRAAETTEFEVAHNLYPGDYLHIAVLQQYTYGILNRPAACLKTKNTPDNVLAEGLEDTSSLRLIPDPTPAQRLASSLEWLRRGVNLQAALMLHSGASRAAVLDLLAEGGAMSPTRAEQTLAALEHPLWSTYQYAYWIGRKMVQQAEARARDRGLDQALLRFLYSELHVPQTFGQEVDRFLAAASSAGGPTPGGFGPSARQPA